MSTMSSPWSASSSDSASSILASFLGALQASLSVLLVIFYGVLAGQFQLLDDRSGKAISKICVRMFLPALMITKIGSELSLESAGRYLPILAWALSYCLVSMAIGMAAVKLFKLPQWVIPAVAFNNTTSLPLLLVQSMESTGILNTLLRPHESPSDAIERAKSYFLVCAIVGNCLTFAVGPRLIDSENGPDEPENGEGKGETGSKGGRRRIIPSGDAEQGGQQQQQQDANEHTSLLPGPVRRGADVAEDRVVSIGKRGWDRLSPRTQAFLSFCSDFLNPPLIGAVIGCLIGLVSPLHKALFNDSLEGGFLNAWLTSSLKNIGQLFVTLQVIVVGVSLSSALRKMKRGEDSGIQWIATLFVIAVRFVLWPVISIAVIWILATKTTVLDDDPILWFAMMLMPTGPPAMKLVAMADVNGAEEEEKMNISKLLTVSYAISPIIALAVVGSLRASQAAIDH